MDVPVVVTTPYMEVIFPEPAKAVALCTSLELPGVPSVLAKVKLANTLAAVGALPNPPPVIVTVAWDELSNHASATVPL